MHFSQETEKTTENRCQTSKYVGRDSNWGPLLLQANLLREGKQS
jgi:hypothetical protein